MLLRSGLLLVTLFFYIDDGFAQSTDYSITHYTTDQGLPQNSIKSINFDKAGYCWLGTEIGLVRFDGLNFKVFGLNDIKGLYSDRIRAIARDTLGDTYVEIDNGQQMAIIISQSGRVPFPKLLKGQPMCFSPPNKLAVTVPQMSDTLNNFVHSVQYGGMENICIATTNGSTYFVVGSKVYYVHGHSMELIDSFSQLPIGAFATIGSKLIHISSVGKIKVWYNGILQPRIQNMSGPLANNRNFMSGNYTLIRSATGTYIYTDQTVYRIDIENDLPKSEVLLKDINIPDIHTIYYHSQQQKYYIGTLTSGFYIVVPNVFHYPQITEQAIKNGFRSQVAAKRSDGIVCEHYLYHRNGSFEVLPIDRHIGATAYLDANDVMYYGASAVLLRFKLGTQGEQKLFELDSRPSGIVVDKTDSNWIWISTSLSVGKLYKDSFKVFKQVSGRKEGSAIWGLAQTSKDSFLLTTEDGVKWYDWEHNRIFKSILDSFSIHCVYVESPDYIWISTNGKGFFLYHKDKVYKLPYGSFNALKSVHSFVDDGKGYFWLPTNNGLYKVSKDALLAYAAGKTKDVYYYSFSTQNSLRSNEFNGGSLPHYVWLKDSMLSLLSIKGPVWFYPNNILVDYPDKHIYVDQLEVDGVAIDYPANRHISLNPDFNSITLSVSSPYFGNKENLQLMYQIESISTDWQPLAADGKVSINRLPSGDYKLIIRKMTGRAAYQFDTLTLSFTVKPRFYNTWWFYTTTLALIGFATYLPIKLRIRLLVDRNKKLQSIIESQTEGLTKTVALLSMSEQDLKESNLLKDNIIMMVLHDLRSPIKFLHIISRKTATRYAELDKEELRQKLVEINTSVAALNDFTEQFFGWAISQRKDFKVNKTWIDLQLLFEETADLYEDLVKINNNTLNIKPGNYRVYTDRNILSVILRNLLDNANKNTRNGTISLYASYSLEHLTITVSDTGKGLRESQIDAFKGKDGDRSETASGYGSMIILNLLEKIGSVLKIDNQPDAGATFHIWLDRSGEPANDDNILRPDKTAAY